MIVGTNIVNQSLATHRLYWGDQHEPRFIDQLIEEMAELTQALMKRRRGYPNGTNLRGEIADVCLCLEFLGQTIALDNEELRTLVGERAYKLDFTLRRNATKPEAGS